MESLNPFYHSHSNNKAKGSFEGLCIGLLFLFQVGFPFEEVKFISIEVSMATKIKGLYKGIKCISHIFVVKEKEMEIGYPTDVKHVAHIGWDGPSGCGPTWMNEFKAAPEFSSSLGSIGELQDSIPASRSSSWASPETGLSVGRQASEALGDLPPSDLPKAPKKHKRRKTRSTSSPKSLSAARTPRAGKSKLKHSETESPLSLQQV